jgi:hypothetical protein
MLQRVEKSESEEIIFCRCLRPPSFWWVGPDYTPRKGEVGSIPGQFFAEGMDISFSSQLQALSANAPK